MKNNSIFNYFVIIFGLCTCAKNNADCTDCGDGLLDGYPYKEVTLEDVGRLAEIAVHAEIGACIRFKKDDIDFTEAVIVDKCCCIQFQ